MNKTMCITLALAITCTLMTTNCYAQHYCKKIKTFFTNYKLEKTDQQEFSTLSVKNISIDNINGPITIKTGWKKNSLLLKTTKRARKQEDLNNIEVMVDSSKNNYLTITTNYINPKLTGSVEYELIVPTSLNIALTISGNGDAFIKDIYGTINVNTNDNITIINTHKSVTAYTHKKGSITIANTQGPVNVHSYHGNIYGENISHSFNAHSSSGKVIAYCKEVPSISAINLKTISGNIVLALPVETNAEIHGYTEHGTLISDHPITLRPYTTQLNNSAWNKFKKAVDGTIGTGEASIALHSINGNVKIIETKTT
ncbi:MAG TPA: hypothetical protein VLB80_00970 [Candidatus Babeliales bacterium]|nr:hypothetical protein [Candidatus Babeliales bacterium]